MDLNSIINFSWMNSSWISYVFIIMGLFFFAAVIVALFYVYVNYIGKIYGTAMVCLETQNGFRWVKDKVRYMKDGDKMKFKLSKLKHFIATPPDHAQAQYDKKSKIMFLRRHHTDDGKYYYNFITTFHDYVFPSVEETIEADLLPETNDVVLSWALDKAKQVNDEYPRHVKSIVSTNIAIISVSIICFIFMFIITNSVIKG